MGPLPDGIVTFLFSDVEGSTRLLERDPDALGRALARHHELTADLVAEHRGAVFETVGDAVYAAFASPTDGLAAAAAIQRAMAATDWSPLPPLRVRIAVERGPVERRGAHYFGSSLFRCARLQALAWGGQTLCSADVAGVVGDLLPGLRLRPRGPHRLKDLAEPMQVFQVDVDRLPADGRPLRGASATPTNLPAEMTTFVGRRDELAEIASLLDAHRLVTLLGPGGTGKTRLAIEVAREALPRFVGGVFLVELAAVTDRDAVGPTIASALDVSRRPYEDPKEALVRHLGDAPTLLVLDNWEQVMPGAAFVGRLLAAASPGLRVLATSRIPLGVRGERQVPVPPLDPDHDARALFRDRAAAAGARLRPEDDDAIGHICRRLDGLPLAIELAASQARTRPMALIRREVERNLASTGWRDDVPERQRTLERSIAWSVGLLEPGLRELFIRLGAFAGSFSAAAAGFVTRAADAPDTDGLPGDVPALAVESLAGLAALADASLLEPREDPLGEPRFAMLQTIRAHAAGTLDAHADAVAVRARHAMWVRDIVHRAEKQLLEEDAPAWVRTLDLAREDVVAALEHCLSTGDGATACAIVADAWVYWDLRGFRPDEVQRATRAVELPGASGPVRAKAFNTVGIITSVMSGKGPARDGSLGSPPAGHLQQGAAWFERAIDLYRLDGPSGDLADALSNLACSHPYGDPRSIPLLEESVALQRSAGTVYGLVNSLTNLAMTHAWNGNVAVARATADEGLRHAEGHHLSKVAAIASHASAYAAYAAGDTTRMGDDARRAVRKHIEMQAEALAWMPADLVALSLVRAGRSDDGGTVHGWGARLRTLHGILPDEADRALAAALEAEGQAALGPEAWAAACARGAGIDDAELLRIIEAS